LKKNFLKTDAKKADIKIGFLCNNHCFFCAQGERRNIFGNRSETEIKQALKKASRDCQIVVFTGGEPTIRKDIFTLVAFAKKIKFSIIQIQSNGRMFVSKDFCRKIIAAGANEFALALHGHIPQLHDYLTGSPGSFQQTLKGIKNLKSLGQPVLMNTVVVKSNYRHLPQIAKLLIGLEVDQFQFAFVHPIASAAKNFDSIVPRISFVSPYLRKALEIGEHFNKKVMTEGVPYCFLVGYENCLSEDIIPSMKIFEPDRIISDFAKVRINEEKAKGPNCQKCKYFKTCEGPWKEYPQKFGWDEFAPIKK
jgi:MoaA/NifB/PqqE/SkfB family radical SAM enzyme